MRVLLLVTKLYLRLLFLIVIYICAVLAEDAVKAAIKDFQKKRNVQSEPVAAAAS